MDPRDFQALAVRLCSGATASELRTAIGRSYYAVFNVGASHLREQGFAISKGAAAHGEVQKCLNSSGDPDVAAVAAELNDLHAARNRADYQLSRADPEDRRNVEAIVTSSGELIHLLDTCFLGPKRGQLRLSISNWRRDNGYP